MGAAPPSVAECTLCFTDGFSVGFSPSLMPGPCVHSPHGAPALPAPPHLCSPTRLLLQGCCRGRGGPILRAAGSHPPLHPDRLPSVDHPERGALLCRCNHPSLIICSTPHCSMLCNRPRLHDCFLLSSPFRFLSKKQSEAGMLKDGHT